MCVCVCMCATNPKTIFRENIFGKLVTIVVIVGEYFREVSAFFQEVSAYFREVSAYFRLETSFQNLETSFEKFGVILATRGLE